MLPCNQNNISLISPAVAYTLLHENTVVISVTAVMTTHQRCLATARLHDREEEDKDDSGTLVNVNLPRDVQYIGNFDNNKLLKTFLKKENLCFSCRRFSWTHVRWVLFFKLLLWSSYDLKSGPWTVKVKTKCSSCLDAEEQDYNTERSLRLH